MAPRALYDQAALSVAAWGTPRTREILIIDDDALVRETLEQIIVALRAGKVTQAASGIEAIHMVTAEPERFDVVFCDLQMPGSDGLDVLEACAHAGMKKTVILMSGSGEGNLRAAAAKAQEWETALALTMAKPFSVAEVKAILQNVSRLT
jgi:CheY-like chemotaxis protein